jgi:Flp pilus assembly protein TadD
VAWARLAVLEDDATPDRRWLLRLDRALLLFEARRWTDAAALLKTVDAPQSSHGFGQAAVDYWLGLALERSGDFTGARQAYSRALELPGARLYHADGPYLLPRVRARLAGLGGG